MRAVPRVRFTLILVDSRGEFLKVQKVRRRCWVFTRHARSAQCLCWPAPREEGWPDMQARTALYLGEPGGLQERKQAEAGERRAEQKAQADAAAEQTQDAQLLGGLDALGNHVEAERMGHGDDGGDDGGVIFAVSDVAHEGADEYEGLARKTLEIAERRIAGAEVVDGEAHSDLAEASEIGLGGGVLLHHHALGDFQFQQRCWELQFAEHAALKR